jgi:hypothetical protein
MARTQLNLGAQGADGTVLRTDLNTTTAGSALITKVIAGTGITFSWTGADEGTGDVTINTAGGGGSVPFDVILFVQGSFANTETLASINIRRAFSFPSGLTGSRVDSKTAATASTTITFTKNGSSIGTAVFAASGTVATLTFVSAVSFAIGDVFEIVGPISADATLANVRFNLLGTLS